MGLSLKRQNSKLSRAACLFALTYSLVAVIAMALCLIIAHFSGYRTDTVHPWIVDLVLLGVMGYAVIAYKKNPISNHVVNTRQAYLFCVLIGVAAAILYFIFAGLYIDWIRPELPLEYVEYHINLMDTGDISDTEKIANRQILAQVKPWGLAFIAFQELFLISALAPLILSIFVRSER